MVLRIALPYPNHGAIYPQTKASVDKLIESGLFDEVQLGMVQGSNVDLNRNQAINANWDGEKLVANFDNREYQELTGFEYLLSLDADIEFEPEHVAALLKWKLPIVSGAYIYRNNPTLYTAGYYYRELGLTRPSTMLLRDSHSLNTVDWVGGGFLLVTREALNEMSYPWFYKTWLHYQERGVARVANISEDVGFCVNAHRHNLKVAIDCDTEVIHHVT
jgi:hypothetical protein